MRRRLLWTAAAGLVVLAAAGAAAWRHGRAIERPLATVAEGTVAVRVTGPGTVQARVAVTLGARIAASVTQMNADVGDAVRQGQLLVLLDDRDLEARRGVVSGQQEALQRNTEAAAAALAKAEAERELARSRHGRDADLLARGFVSAAALDASHAGLAAAAAGVDAARAALAARTADARSLAQEARLADTVRSHARVLAPMDAIVVQRTAEPGSTVVPGSPLLKLVVPRSLWVATRIDEAVVGRVQPGQPATIRLRSGETLAGRVARIARQSDAATRELEVDVAFDNPPQRFAIDQEAEVGIEVGQDRGLRVPLAALARDRAGHQGVWLVLDGAARFQAVETGAADAQHVLVRQGLRAGQTVVAVAAGVAEGQRVQAAAPQR
ncbi:Efflux RND transporter periplasmic adaptor subunit [Rubrivivax sp. A210]|uniref:efflux RND transporter periplasmic adaptor subunit n=1 Tax=Rubrivivax sp. A210 TaxID=2772301 RepID=UPI00191882A2|nr:efflux RND transporter periplasmic adaptor subunit [Rubrivivax sp. A210]CAD5373902.1 Efflux RND transporter periplasmic adaptor subunit [Rubrivivax sp. A210]